MSETTEVRYTPGPWAWDNTPHGARLMTQHSGRLVVMDCTRRGLQDAEPRFSDRGGERRGGIMHPASKLDLFEHPDAALIAAAPELLEACRALLAWCAAEDNHEGDHWHRVALWEAARDKANAAIARAEGRATPAPQGATTEEE